MTTRRQGVIESRRSVLALFNAVLDHATELRNEYLLIARGRRPYPGESVYLALHQEMWDLIEMIERTEWEIRTARSRRALKKGKR